MINPCASEKFHLLFCSAHEKEPRGAEKLEAMLVDAKQILQGTTGAYGGRTNGVIYWKLFASVPSGLSVLRSPNTKAISMILAAPAAISV